MSTIIPNDECKSGNNSNYLLLKAHKPGQNYTGRFISTGCTSDLTPMPYLLKGG